MKYLIYTTNGMIDDEKQSWPVAVANTKEEAEEFIKTCTSHVRQKAFESYRAAERAIESLYYQSCSHPPSLENVAVDDYKRVLSAWQVKEIQNQRNLNEAMKALGSKPQYLFDPYIEEIMEVGDAAK